MGKKNLRQYFFTYVFLFIGSFLAAVALEIFLVPNNVIDGGIVGISIILSHLLILPLGLTSSNYILVLILSRALSVFSLVPKAVNLK